MALIDPLYLIVGSYYQSFTPIYIQGDLPWLGGATDDYGGSLKPLKRFFENGRAIGALFSPGRRI